MFTITVCRYLLPELRGKLVQGSLLGVTVNHIFKKVNCASITRVVTGKAQLAITAVRFATIKVPITPTLKDTLCLSIPAKSLSNAASVIKNSRKKYILKCTPIPFIQSLDCHNCSESKLNLGLILGLKFRSSSEPHLKKHLLPS